jgi:hypothetical protein
MTHALDYNFGFGLALTDPIRAIELLEAAAHRSGIAGHATEVWAVYHHAAALHLLGRMHDAAREFSRFFSLPPHGNVTAIIGALEMTAHLLGCCDRSESAARVGGSAERWREVMGLAGQSNEVAARADLEVRLASALPPEERERLRREGQALTLEQAIRAARAAVDELIT